VLNDLVEQFGIVPHCIDGMRATPGSLCHLCHLCAIYAIYVPSMPSMVSSEASMYAAQRTQRTRSPCPYEHQRIQRGT
jgi:hypothetical protein